MKEYARLTRAELIELIRKLEQETTANKVQQAERTHERRQAQTVLRDSETRLRAILETAVEGIITIDERGVIESVNPAAERIFGYPAAQLVGQNVSRLMPSPSRDEHDGYLANYLHTGESKIIGIGREVAGQRKDGTIFPMDLSVSEVRLADRRLFTGFVRDVTQRKQLEKEILEISNREQRRIGHDLHDGLGQQLTGLEMKCFLLLEDLAAKDFAARRELLQEQARQMSQALRECIAATRSLAHSLAPVNLKADGLTGALEQLAHRTHMPGKIECRFVCRAPVTLDNSKTAGHLYRIAQEAVNNALKHARTRRIHINLAQNEGMLRLQIKDDGRGLPKRRKSKSGMGLEVMRHRAHVIGASLEIGSKPGKGVSVTCTLPLENHEH